MDNHTLVKDACTDNFKHAAETCSRQGRVNLDADLHGQLIVLPWPCRHSQEDCLGAMDKASVVVCIACAFPENAGCQRKVRQM